MMFGWSRGGGGVSAPSDFPLPIGSIDYQLDLARTTPRGYAGGETVEGGSEAIEAGDGTFARASAALDIGVNGAPVSFDSGAYRVARDTISHAVLGLRIERGITSTTSYTTSFNNASQETAAGTNIDGTNTLINVTSSVADGFSQSFFDISADTEYYTASIDVPAADEDTSVKLQVVLASAATTSREATMNRQTGYATSSDIDTFVFSELLKTPHGRFWRLSLTMLNAGNDTAILRFTPAVGDTGSCLRGGMRVDKAPYPLATTTATDANVTRAAETLAFDFYPASAAVRADVIASCGPEDRVLVQWDDGSENNRVTWWYRGDTASLECELVSGGSPIASHDHGPYPRPVATSLDFAFGGGVFKSLRGGVEIETTSLTLPTGLDTLRVGGNTTTVSGDLILQRLAWKELFAVISGALPYQALPYGNKISGSWSGQRRWYAQDIVNYGGVDYYAVRSHSDLSGTVPSADTLNWQPCPAGEYTTLLANDTLLDDAGFFYSGGENVREAPSGQLWHVSGAGYTEAKVIDATGATSAGNTYFFMPVGQTGIGRVEIDALENNIPWPDTVISIGGTASLPHEQQMDHNEITATGVTDTYWYDNDVVSTLYDSDGNNVYVWNSPDYAKPNNEFETYVVERRGNFRFAFADGVLIQARCHPKIGQIWDEANSVYLQNTGETAEIQLFKNFKVYG